MKTLYLAAFAAGALLPSVSLAQPPQLETDNVVRAPTYIGVWSNQVAQDLSKALRYPAVLSAREDSGIVAVNFTANDDGTASDFSVARSSGSTALDRAALRAVSRMGQIDPLPRALGPSVVVRANIIFAQDHGQLRHYTTQLQREELASRDRNGADQPRIALTVGLSPIG